MSTKQNIIFIIFPNSIKNTHKVSNTHVQILTWARKETIISHVIIARKVQKNNSSLENVIIDMYHFFFLLVLGGLFCSVNTLGNRVELLYFFSVSCYHFLVCSYNFLQHKRLRKTCIFCTSFQTWASSSFTFICNGEKVLYIHFTRLKHHFCFYCTRVLLHNPHIHIIVLTSYTFVKPA